MNFLICLGGLAAIVIGLLVAAFLILAFANFCLEMIGHIREEWRKLKGGAE